MIWSIGVTFVLSMLIVIMLTAKGVPCRRKWSPISEEEFIRRCSPGVNRERALKVRRIISEQLGVEYDRIYPEQRFVEDLKCD
jgi:hypothetical protein